MADKNLDQLQRVGATEPNDLLHLRRNGLDYSISSEDLASTLTTPEDTLLGVTNVGTGGGIIHKTTAANIAQLRRISGSGNVTVTTASDNIVVSVSGDGTKVDKVDTAVVGNFASFTADGGVEDSSYSQANFATSAQGGLADTALQDIVNESIGDLIDVNLTGISAGDTLVWDDANSEFVPGTASGTLNGLSNVGGGTEIYKDVTGGVANLKTLVAGSGVVFTAGADTIQIDATGTGGGEANTGVNLGTGEVVFAQKSGVNLEFKTLKAGTGVTLSSSATEITVGSDAVGTTNLNYTASPTEGIIVSDTGTDATIPAGSATNASLMLPEDKTKLDGIQTGAQVNTITSVNSQTGVIVLTAADVGAEPVGAVASHIAAPNPHPQYTDSAEATSIASAAVTNHTSAVDPHSQYQMVSAKGVANGYASLDAAGKVPSIQLPSFVDDVIEVADVAALPAIGETGKIYITVDSNKVYRWSGSTYTEIIGSPGSTDSVPEGSTNLYFTTQRAAAASPVQSVNGQSGAVVLTPASVGAQPADATLTAMSGVTTASDRIIYFTGVDVAAPATLTSFGRSLIDDNDATAARITLGLGTAATRPISDFATATQGAKADTALQPVAGSSLMTTAQATKLSNLPTAEELISELGGKVDKVAGSTLMTTAQAGKLAGIAAEATKNATDAQLRDRATHTGEQPISSVTGLQGALDSKVGAGDGSLTNSREWTAETISQAEAEARTATTRRAWTAQRVGQAIAAWWAATGTAFGRAVVSWADAAEARGTLGLGSRTISASGDGSWSVSFDGTANVSSTLTLANSGVTAGTYPKVTVDAKGRVTAGTALAATDIPALDWSKITTGKPTTIAGYGITNAQPLDATLTALAGVATAADRIIYFTGADAASAATLTAFGRSLIDDADASTALTTLGVSTFAKTLLDDADAAAARATLRALSATAASGLDANTFTESGLFQLGGEGWANVPIGVTGLGDHILNAHWDRNAATQLYLPFRNSEALAWRRKSGGSYSSWMAIYHEGNKPTPAGIGAQASDPTLTALAGLTGAADRLPYFNGTDTATLATFTAFARTLLDDATATEARTTLGLGTAATKAAQTSATDTTAGALMGVGAFGLGGGGATRIITEYPATASEAKTEVFRSSVSHATVSSYAPSWRFLCADTWGRIAISHASPRAWVQGGWVEHDPKTDWTAELWHSANLTPNKLESRTKATLPTAAANSGMMYLCTDAAGGAAPVISNGTAWLAIQTTPLT